MIDAETINDLVIQYEKHGWKLERVLLTSELFAKLDRPLSAKYGSAVARLSTVNAVWFSRANGDKTSWEIRRLAGSPFALVRFVPAGANQSECESILRSAEIELTNSLIAPPTEH